jgi:hypothetical protein
LLLDARFDDACQIAVQAATPGLEILTLERDVLSTWYEWLAPGTSRTPAAFAGITTEHGFFLLRTLAADHRLHVRFTARHGVARGGQMVHEVAGPAALVARCRPASGHWQEAMGPALRGCPSGRATGLRFTSPAGGSTRRDEALVSWIIGPARRG